MVMNGFTDAADQFGQIFSSGMADIVSNGINAISGPLTGLVVLWLIVQGILVMRGDISVRTGTTKIMRVSIIVALVSSLALFSQYIVETFQVTLPNFVSDTFSNGTSTAATTPHMFDRIWDYSMAMVERTNALMPVSDVVDGVQLAIFEFAIGTCLIVSFTVYEVSQIMIGLVIGLGPFVLIGYLFDATRGIALRWIGLLIGLSLLALLIAMALNIILRGEQSYIQSIVAMRETNLATNLAILMQVILFYALGAVIILLLPIVAIYIGAGLNLGMPAQITTNNQIANLSAGRTL